MSAVDLGFEGYVREVAPDLLSYFVRRVHPPEDAADCVAETLVVLWRRSAELPAEVDPARAWAFGVARGVLSNYRRAGSRRLALADALRGTLEVQHAPSSGEMESEVVDALSTLKESDRELVLLVAWEGLTLESAATVLGIKAPAARARYSRARAKLRAVLSDS